MKATIVRRAPVQVRGSDTIQDVLAAASRLLAGGTLTDLTTTRIAAEAGISVGALYRFFPDKQAIIDAIAEARMEEFGVVLEQRFSGLSIGDGPGFLATVIDAYVAFLDEHADFRTLALGRHIGAATRERHVSSEAGPASLVKRFMLQPLGVELSPEIDLKLRVASETGDRLIAYAYEQQNMGERRRIVSELKAMLSAYLFSD